MENKVKQHTEVQQLDVRKLSNQSQKPIKDLVERFSTNATRDKFNALREKTQKDNKKVFINEDLTGIDEKDRLVRQDKCNK